VSRHDAALVLFSGGQDSATCLVWALERYAHVETVGFRYGQRHEIELSVRDSIRLQLRALKAEWSDRLGVDHLISIDALKEISETALTREVDMELSASGLPNTFVPARNLVFFALAGALAYRRDMKHLVTGVCETDYSGYPDCRDDTVKAFQVALNLGTASQFILQTPLMWINKAQTWALANALGGAALVELIKEHTHTCYRGDRSVRHAWGYGCDRCPACELRRKGWLAYSSGAFSVGQQPT
jgi:7-cyano-7-deazaguanine synthase